jgi:hypothetical protein
MAIEAEEYNITAIRELLTAAFMNSRALRSFCNSHREFQPFLQLINEGAGLQDHVDKLIDYCKTYILFDELLAGVYQINPRQYARFIEPELSGAEPTEVEPGRSYGTLGNTANIALIVGVVVAVLAIGASLLVPEVRHWIGLEERATDTPVPPIVTPSRPMPTDTSVPPMPTDTSLPPVPTDTSVLPTPTDTSTPVPTDTPTATSTHTRTPTPTTTPTDTPTATPTNTFTPTPIPPPDFTGRVCKVKSGWDTNTIFLREDEFKKLGLPIGTRVTVRVRDTNRSYGNMTLSLDGGLDICSVRLGQSRRIDLGVDNDVTIEPESDRLIRQFDIVKVSSPTNRESSEFQGRVCKIESGWDTETVFLRQLEFNAFGVPAGTTVSVTVETDTGRTVEKVALVNTDIATCVVRLSKSLREALGVAGDTDINPASNRPIRSFTIRLSQP